MVALRLRTALSQENRAGEGGQIREVTRLNNIYLRFQHAMDEFVAEFGFNLERAEEKARYAVDPPIRYVVELKEK